MAGPGQAGAGAGAGGSSGQACPVCHEPLAEELVMLPCGHALCHPCSVKLTELGHASPRVRILPPPLHSGHTTSERCLANSLTIAHPYMEDVSGFWQRGQTLEQPADTVFTHNLEGSEIMYSCMSLTG